jgi:hypothetical protein
MRTIPLLLLLGTLSACSSRVLSNADGAVVEAVEGDGQKAPDACVLPAGWCHSTEECPAGQTCVGCHSDPCHPGSRGCVGRCVNAFASCTSNADCEGSRFCYFESGCGKTGPGVCKYAPGGCTADCPGVCGCDGKTYCNACAAWKVGVSTDPSGAACAVKMSCAQLNQAYMKTVQQAKTCCPTCKSSVDQCALLVWHALPTGCPCPCQTYVNPSNKQDLQKLKDLEQKWLAQKCGPGLPPPQMDCCALYPACQPAKFGASCIGTGAQGTCQDSPGPTPAP